LLSPPALYTIQQLFPAMAAPGHTLDRVDACQLVEIIAVSLSRALSEDVMYRIGFDRIFVEHLLSRFQYLWRNAGFSTRLPVPRVRKERRLSVVS
jgi:hypothetical protein